MNELPLPALEGTNPLGFLAALGVLEVLARYRDEATLRWTDELVPHAVIGGVGDGHELVELLDQERKEWADSLVLDFPPEAPLADAKPAEPLLRRWFEAAFTANASTGDYRDADLLCAVVAEGAFDGKQNAKPTHLHFTAGRQQLLTSVRTLRNSIGQDRLREAVFGPWAHDSPLPSLSWDASRGERIYAVRGHNPSNDKRLGVPGADWLAFRGLACYPVHSVNGSLRTTACQDGWKRSGFRWPLWTPAGSREAVRSLVADPVLVAPDGNPRPAQLRGRGVFAVLQAPIRRSDQGGYGSFGGPELVASAATSR